MIERGEGCRERNARCDTDGGFEGGGHHHPHTDLLCEFQTGSHTTERLHFDDDEVGRFLTGHLVGVFRAADRLIGSDGNVDGPADPCEIIHGRDGLLCVFETAGGLVQKWQCLDGLLGGPGGVRIDSDLAIKGFSYGRNPIEVIVEALACFCDLDLGGVATAPAGDDFARSLGCCGGNRDVDGNGISQGVRVGQAGGFEGRGQPIRGFWDVVVPEGRDLRPARRAFNEEAVAGVEASEPGRQRGGVGPVREREAGSSHGVSVAKWHNSAMTLSLPVSVSETFDPTKWRLVEGFEFTDITYHRGVERSFDGNTIMSERDLPIVRIAFDRPEVRNAFRPETVDELYRALDHARLTPDVGAIILTGNGPSTKDGGWAFCSGGDQRIRGNDGYRYDGGETSDEHAKTRDTINPERAGRLHILEVQRLIRTMPKVVIAAVSGWAAGGGHSLNVVCDLSIASIEHGKFKQTDANVGSFDAGYGSALLARQTGDKRAREIFFLAREYSAEDAAAWGVVNEAVPHSELEEKAWEYAQIVLTKSPQAIRMLKFAFNLPDDGIAGQQVFAGEATRLAYMTTEAAEGRDAFLEKREPNWSDFPYYA